MTFTKEAVPGTIIRLRTQGLPGAVFCNGSSVTAVIDADGYAWAWGTGSVVGNNQPDPGSGYSSPVSVVGAHQFRTFARGVVGYSASVFALTLLDSLSYAWAWGNGPSGELGNNNAVNASSPVSVVGGRQWISLNIMDGGTVVALDPLSYAWAWGLGTSGQLGNGAASSASSPVSVQGGKQWSAIVSANGSVLALDNLSYAWGWGTGTAGQFGQVTTALNTSSPLSIAGGRQWRQLIGGSTSIYGLDNLSYAWAWGTGATGLLGNGGTGAASSPSSVLGGRQFSSLFVLTSVGAYGLDANSYAWSWGTNTNGLLGINVASAGASSPVSVVGGRQFSAFFPNTTTIYGLDSRGFLWGWGSNANGILGDGTTSGLTRSSPVSIQGGPSLKEAIVSRGTSSIFRDWNGNILVSGNTLNGTIDSGRPSSSPVIVVRAKNLAPSKPFGG